MITTNDSIQQLNALTFPLFGARLIEASAGTGKTYTSCSLYVRLILGHGDNNNKPISPLTVEQILVVTFTEAATEELRSRIRTRIKDTRLAFLRGYSSDPLTSALLDDVVNHELAIELLLTAERQMDEAAIFTIHGFCQRMLVDSAFESGTLFETNFLTDETKIRNQVVCDYWRTRFNLLSTDISEIIRQYWKSPSDLLLDINSYLSESPVVIKGERASGDINNIHCENISKIDKIKELWGGNSCDIFSKFENTDINKRIYTKKSLPKWINDISEWATSKTTTYEIPSALSRFQSSVLKECSLKKDGTQGISPTFRLFDEIEAFCNQKINLYSGLLKDAILDCKQRLIDTKKKIYTLSFDDLLTQLNDALNSEHGYILSNRISELYPVAMIDEFQDTDPLQYNIFRKIYKKCFTDNSNAYGIFMIGDPKQAIYAFRGADIFTYIKARREVNSHYTLNTNWRSTSDMVNAVNHVFNHTENPFIYNEDIDFYPALPSPNSENKYWEIDKQRQKAMVFWLDSSITKQVSKNDYIDTMAKTTVEQIKNILSNPSAQINCGKQKRRIVSGDVAILVRTSNEAKVIRSALSSENIASVYLSSRESVFSSLVAQDILRIITAISDPYNERLLKSTLATHVLGEDAHSLVALEHDEQKLEDVVLEFSNYNQIWTKKGVMPALRMLLINRKISEKLLSSVDGERQVTDYLHIAELLQEQSQKITSKHGLIRWLTERIEDPDGNAEEQQIRLESENDLVKVVTMHKSKGLEYNFVFLPFLANYRLSNKTLYHDHKYEKNVLDTTKSEFSKRQAESERLAEDLRILYVSLTRAVYGCFIGLAPLMEGKKRSGNSGVHNSAIGWIIQSGQSLSAEGLFIKTQELQQKCINIDVCQPIPNGTYIYSPSDCENKNELIIEASKNTRKIDENWYVTSFSALSKNSHTHKEVEIDFSFDDEEEIEKTTENELNIFNFYKGAKAGTFLHSVFENIDYINPLSESNSLIIKDLLNTEGYEADWFPTIKKLTCDILTKKMYPNNIQLSAIEKGESLCEMEFTFPIKNLNPNTLAQVCSKHDVISKGMELNFFKVSGMLKGFIDLTFKFGNKFYILDWKSNHLGDSTDCYTYENIVTAMQEHRYDLQYQIYSLALHKYLRSRMANYSYSEHFGGVLYVFLRGVNSNNDNGIYYSKPTEDFLMELGELIEG